MRIPAGDTTASSERLPIWVTACLIKRWEIFCDATALLRLQNEARQLRGGFYHRSYERPGRRRLLHRGGVELAGLGDLLRAVFHSLESRRVSMAGITRHPDQEWMEQIARGATQETGAIFISAAMFCMIATRSSALRFGRCWRRAACKPFRFRPEARIRFC